MIQVRRKHPYQALALAARDAARRLAPGRLQPRGRRDPWRPTVLRWRRTFKDPVNRPTGRTASPTTMLSFTQFHSHFVTCLSAGPRHDRLGGFTLTGSTQQAQVVLSYLWTSGRAAATPLEGRRTCALRVTDEQSPVSHVAASQPAAIWAAQRLRPLSFARITEGIRASMHTQGQTQRGARRLLIWPHWFDVFSVRTPKPDDSMHRRQEGKRLQSRSDLRDQLARRNGLQASALVAKYGRPQLRSESVDGPYPSQDSKRVLFQFDRPQELVWRRRLLSPTVMTENEPDQEPSRLFHTPQLRSMPSQETVPAVPPAAERSAPLQITKLDPGLVDRLTDDVIHRVERRMRIERQRRGI